MENKSIELENLRDFSKLKVPELKKELKLRGLNTVGHKAELLERLLNALKCNTEIASVDSVDDLDEDLLNGDDDEHLDENDSELNFDASLEVEQPKSAKRKIPENSTQIVKQQKKIVLNRNLTTNTNQISAKDNIDDSKDPEEPALPQKKLIKLSDLSAKERLEMRAKKFGLPLDGDAKKSARAERFGSTVDDLSKTANCEKSTPGVDVLKQRAERFGVSVSTKLAKLDNAEKLEKRKERFGIAILKGSASVQKDKAHQRVKQP